jgi:GTP cyclohydrolase FolE2
MYLIGYSSGVRRQVLFRYARRAFPACRIEMQFPYFARKAAPISRVRSLLDCDIRWRGSVAGTGAYSFRMGVTVPVTSLCPCSRDISDYGAHNQRSHITIDTEMAGEMAIEELIAIAERSASCAI